IHKYILGISKRYSPGQISGLVQVVLGKEFFFKVKNFSGRFPCFKKCGRIIIPGQIPPGVNPVKAERKCLKTYFDRIGKGIIKINCYYSGITVVREGKYLTGKILHCNAAIN